MEQAICERRLAKLIESGATEGSPDYWYGVVEPFAGSLWCQLCVHKSDADKIAADLGGRVVIVAARILEDADGEQIEPAN